MTEIILRAGMNEMGIKSNMPETVLIQENDYAYLSPTPWPLISN